MVETNRRSFLPFLLLGLFLAASVIVIVSAPHLSAMVHRLASPTAGSGAAVSDLPASSEMITRWIMYLSLSAVIGGALFAVFIWRNSYQQWATHQPKADEEATQIVQRIMLIGLAMLALASLVDGVIRQTLLPNADVDGAMLRASLLWGRLILIGVTAFLTTKLPAAANGALRLWITVLALSAIVVLTFSLQSHAAASGMVLPILANYLHITAASAWIGGLMPLAVLLTLTRRRGEDHRDSVPMRILIPRFSLLAITCVTLLTITGIFSTSLLVRTPEALFATGYGRALLAKSGMVAILMALGAVNLMILSPQLNSAEFKACCNMLRVVRTELVIGLMVLIATGLIAGAVPAYKTYRSTYALNLTQEAEVNEVAIRLSADPYPLIVRDRLMVEVEDARPGTSAAQVMVQFGSSAPINLDAGADGSYALRGGYLKAFGPWDVTVIVRRAGYEDVRQQFKLSE